MATTILILQELHCKIRFLKDAVQIKDAGSSNGTELNGKVVPGKFVGRIHDADY